MADPDSDEEAEDQDRRAVASAEEVEETPGSEPEEVSDDEPASSKGSKKDAGRRMLRGAAGAAARSAYEHRHELVAALKLLKERHAVADTDENAILEAYENADKKTRDVIEELVERLERAQFGKVVIGIRDAGAARPSGAGGPGDESGVAGGPETEKEEAAASAPPTARPGEAGTGAAAAEVYIEEVGRRMEQTGRRVVRRVGSEVRDQGEIIVEDLVKQGRRALVQDETKDVERVFFKWTTETITTLEQILVRGLIGTGVVLIVVAILWSAHQVEAMRDVARFASVFALVFTGILLITWSSRVSEWAQESRKEVEDLVVRGPSERLNRMLGDDFGGVRRPAPPDDAGGASAEGRSADPPSAK